MTNGEAEQDEPTPVPEKDISEPVTSFIKCFEANHRRFKLEKVEGAGYYTGRSKFKLTDKKNGESWHVLLADYYRYENTLIDNQWITQDEVNLLVYTFTKFYSERAVKLQSIKSDRHNAKMMKERDRLTKIYKENDQ